MARLTRLSMALISALALAAPSFAADTGMLYVKSNPSGATVVIAGKKRGKTPLLVRGLPTGELTVEFRVAGVKPVTKEVTVRANKVATIDVIIEIPSATLTVVSDPLEATVFLDDREVGETPLTLEHLDPGKHRITLLKGGYPRTARSVVLEPGGERVLEVQLGTGGGDETDGPAPGVAPAASRASGPVPVEVQLILTMLKGAVAKGNYAETRRNLEVALRQPDMADFKDELRGAISVTRSLEGRQDAMRRAVEALVGKDVTLKTKKGSRKGRIEGTSVEGISIASKLMVAGRAVGESQSVIKWSDLAPEERRRLGESWRPEGPDGAVARAVVALARGDLAAAARAAGPAGDHPLAQHLGSRVATSRSVSAEAAWGPIERKARASSISSKQAATLLEEIAAFKTRYGGGTLATSLVVRIAQTESRLRRTRAKALGIPPDALEFGGHSYKLYTQRLAWYLAKAFCERQKGHLATITSREEHNFLVSMCRGLAGAAYIGLTDRPREGQWRWVTGEKVVFTGWGPGQPDNAAGEDYCELIVGRAHWNDVPGRWRKPFICEWEFAVKTGETPRPAGSGANIPVR